MLMFISLFIHQGSQEWGVAEGAQANTFFPLLPGEVAGTVQPGIFREVAGGDSRLRARWSSSLSPVEKAVLTRMSLSGTPSHLVSNHDSPSHDRKTGQALRLGTGPCPPVKGLWDSVHLPPRHCPSPSRKKLIHAHCHLQIPRLPSPSAHHP